MNKIGYFLLILLSKLPFKVLYGISDFLYIIIYHIVGYRKKVVRENLKNSFPEKTENERLKIEKKFYKNFTDYGVESLKIFSMKVEDFKDRLIIENIELLKEIKDKKAKDIMLLMGHVFNWEWLTGMAPKLPEGHTYAVYREIRNEFFSKIMLDLRQKFSCIPLDINHVVRKMMSLPNDGNNLFLFISDQSPKPESIHYELEFLNQITPVYNGFDKIARKKEYSVVYINMNKISKGRYLIKFEEILPDKDKFKENEVIDKFFKKLTDNIYNQPDLWLWTHRRWKYKNGIHYNL